MSISVQVYLGKWQETDVAVKVLTEMQNLSSHEGVHPQDPSNMETWEGNGPPARQGGEKATKAAGLKLTDSDAHGWGTDDDDDGVSSIGADSEVVPSEERQEALRTLEREVCATCFVLPYLVYSWLLLSTPVYSCLLLSIPVYSCLLLSTHVLLSTPVYSCLLLSTLVYSCLLLPYLVYSCLLLSTDSGHLVVDLLWLLGLSVTPCGDC